MKPEPEPCSTCGRRRSCGKKSSKPGGSRWLSARSVRCDLMNTTAGFTCSATATNASPSSAAGFAAGIWVLGAVAWAAGAGAPLGGVQRRARGRVGLLQLVQCLGDLVRAPRPEGLLRALDGAVQPG